MKNKSIKHWIVLTVCCGLAAASIGISINSSGVFYTPVSNSLKIMRGTFSMHMTVFSLSTAFSALVVGKLINKISYKLLLIISVIVAVISTGLMAVTKTVAIFYLLGAVRGFSTGMFSIVPLTMIINNWFDKNHGLATSIVFGFSGLSGSIFSPILSNIIEIYGWQTGYLIKALIILGLCLPAILYPFKLDPRDNGYLPYGYEKTSETKAIISNHSFNFISVSFISFVVFGLLSNCITSFTQHFPGYGMSLGYSAAIGAMLLSAGMVGNIVSKLIIGILSDRIGAIKATVTMILANTLGIILLMIGSSEMLLVSGAFLFGSSYSIGAVALPLLTKYFFGIDNYGEVFPKISFASNIGAAVSLSMIGYIYDFFGSYIYAFIIALIMILICILTLVITLKNKGEY